MMAANTRQNTDLTLDALNEPRNDATSARSLFKCEADLVAGWINRHRYAQFERFICALSICIDCQISSEQSCARAFLFDAHFQHVAICEIGCVNLQHICSS